MNKQLKELQRRIIEDIKIDEGRAAEEDLNFNEVTMLRARIDGMKVALFEISALDKPYIGSDENDN